MNVLNQIVNSIAKTLNKNFPNITILDNEIQQEIKAPAFFIRQISIDTEEIRTNRIIINASFDIVYFPSSDYPDSECYEVETKLLEITRYIDDVEGGYGFRGEFDNARIVDDILHFLIDIKETLVLDETQPPRIERIYFEKR